MNHEDKGLLYNFTGNGKGKTSAAFGVAIRALGWHWRVAVFQFMKGDRPTGELQFFSEHFPEVPFRRCGLGRTNRPGNHAECAREGWLDVSALLNSFEGELLVLDELNMALSYGYLNTAEVIFALKNRRPDLNVIVTGRHSPPELIEISDLVSEVGDVKHPYRQGVPARKGLDF